MYGVPKDVFTSKSYVLILAAHLLIFDDSLILNNIVYCISVYLTTSVILLQDVGQGS